MPELEASSIQLEYGADCFAFVDAFLEVAISFAILVQGVQRVHVVEHVLGDVLEVGL